MDNDKSCNVNEYSLDIQTLLKKGKMALEDKDWDAALEVFDKILDSEPNCAEAYIGKFLWEKKSVNLSNYFNSLRDYYSNNVSRESVTACEEAKDHIADMINIYKVPGKFETREITDAYEFDRTYSSALADCKHQYAKQNTEFNNNPALTLARKYATSDLKDEIENEISSLLNMLDERITLAAQEDSANSAKIISDYEKFITVMDEKVAKRSFECKSEVESENSKKNLVTLLSKKRKLIAIASGNILLAIIGVIAVYNQVYVPRRDYNKAIEAMENQSYEEAKLILEELQDYEDASSLLDECDNGIMYKRAIELINSDSKDLAIPLLKQLGNYKDSRERLDNIFDEAYVLAEELYNSDNLTGAYNSFKELGSFKDSSSKSEMIACEIAKDYERNGDISNANLWYSNANGDEADLNPKYHIGERIQIGRYGGEELNWIILDRDGNRYMIITEKAIEAFTYHDFRYDWTAEYWLDNDFYNTVFNEDEKEKVLLTKLSIENDLGDYVLTEEVERKIFFISKSDAERFFLNDESRIAYPGSHAAYTNEYSHYENEKDNGAWSWWLRDPYGRNMENIYYVSNEGTIETAVIEGTRGVRPAVWVDLSE